MGLPSEFTQEIADVICERIADGESLRKICSEPSMPNKATVFRWLAQFPTFSDQYARCREEQAETHADGLVDISDERPPLDQFGKVDPGYVAAMRLRIDTRKWVASKLKPKKYGERVQQDVTVTTLTEVLAAVDGTALGVKRGDE